MKRAVLAILIGVAFTFGIAPLAHAQESETEDRVNRTTTRFAEDTRTTETDTETSTESTERSEALKERARAFKEAAASKVEAKREKLNAAKLELCVKKEEHINTVMSNVAQRGQKHFDFITTILERTQTYYSEKSLTVENYETLVTTAEEKKEAAQAAITSLADTPVFTCDGDAPKADLEAFSAERQAKIDAMKEYRNAVKSLVHEVRDAAKPATEGDQTDE